MDFTGAPTGQQLSRRWKAKGSATSFGTSSEMSRIVGRILGPADRLVRGPNHPPPIQPKEADWAPLEPPPTE
eukprot:4271827-Prorocentrum_lima.AAC.1